MGRAPCCEKVGLKRGRWTVEEDERLTNYILQNGQGSWRSLPKNAGLLRCGKSCRLRWINYLRADLKRGDITPQEEDTIIKLHATLGNRWSAIAGQLPGRTDNEIKNYWNSHLSRRIHTIRRPNGEENVINLSNVSAPPKRRGGRTSRAAMQRNKNNNVIYTVSSNKNFNPILSENDLRNNNNSNNSNLPQFGSTLDRNLVGDENLLLGIEDIMDLDGLLSTSEMSSIGPNDSNGLIGMGPIGEDQEQYSGLANSTRSNGGGSTPSSSSSPSTLSCFDQFDGGLGWDMEIDMIYGVSANFDQLCDEKDQIISWLWENDDNYLGPVFADVTVDVDSDKEQAMLEWLMS